MRLTCFGFGSAGRCSGVAAATRLAKPLGWAAAAPPRVPVPMPAFGPSKFRLLSVESAAWTRALWPRKRA
eukprot:2200194-Prymnesium_polylepis.1